MNTYPWLTTIILFPVFAGLLIPLIPNRGNNLIRWYALGICLIDFIFMTYVFGSHYDFYEKGIQLKEDIPWINLIDFHWRVGVDGLSIALVLLTGFITTLATLAAWPVTRNPRLFYFLMLAMYSGQLGLFLSQDLLLFFFMWELELIPVYILLSLWGGRRRLYAATKFILYTAGGSIFLLAAILTISLCGDNGPILDMETLSTQSYPLGLEILLYLGFFIAFAVKLPVFPFHTWLPDTHGEAHYSTCMLLAGILLKMGGYGFIRLNIELLPNAHYNFAPWLVALGAGQIVYAALVSIAQKNLKRRIAYSSISHMGFVLIGAGSFTDLGLSGAMLQMISHGLIGAALFFLAGTTYDRSRSLILDDLGGWGAPLPKIFSLFTICAMASLALPGMSGFVAELMVFLGVLTSSAYSPFFRAIITFVEGIGIILTPIYLLSMVRKIFYGYTEITLKASKVDLKLDASPREVFIILSLVLPMLGIGFYPDITLQLWNEKTKDIVFPLVKTFSSYQKIFY